MPRRSLSPAALAAVVLVLAACDSPSPEGRSKAGIRTAPPAPTALAERPDAGPSAAERAGGTRADLDAPEAAPSEPAQLAASPAGSGDTGAAPAPLVLALRHDHDPDVDHLADGDRALADGDGAKALEDFRKAVFDTGSYESYLGVSRSALKLGDKPLALEALEGAARVEPEKAEPLVMAARLCLGSKEIRKGLKLVDRAIAREPRSAEAFNVRGRLEMAQEQYDRAILAFQRAIDIDPAFVWAYNNLGYVQLVTGRYEKAIDALEVATTLRPVKAYMFNNLGLAYEKSGRLVDAWHAFNQAVSMKPGYVNAQLNLERVRTVAMVRSQEAKDARGAPVPTALPSPDAGQ